MRKTLYMETTQVSALKTAGEIQALLVQSGARQISQQYGTNGRILGMMFSLSVKDGVELPFALPVRTESVFKILRSKRKTYIGAKEEQGIREQAERVAWRQLLRWIEAQLAMIDCGMAKPAEVFMPYLTNGRQTMFEQIESRGYAGLLTAPEAQS